MIENMLHKHRYFGHSGEIHECCPWSVTTVSPMKRGLKGMITTMVRALIFTVTTVSPMKRGLKDTGKPRTRNARKCYNRFPDEKGTERNHKRKESVFVVGYNRFPDEKGTESRITRFGGQGLTEVTTVSPMKRGLKVCIRGY